MSLFDIFKKKNAEQSIKLITDIPSINSEQEKRYALEAYRQLKDESKTTCIKIALTDTKPNLFQSKIGGMGYIPHNSEIPTDSKGRQLRLLAQIDCSEIKINEYPKEGLLQFWILNDDVYGMNFENITRQDTFKIIYHKNIDKSVSEEEVKIKFKENEFDKDDMMPCHGEYGINFNISEDSLSMSDYRLDGRFTQKYNKMNPDKKIESYGDTDLVEIADKMDDDSEAFGHKIGGYPAFTQYDPRDEESPYDFLLLQLDSDFDGDIEKIMWGDSGICNFFINSEKLKNLDFSDVIYNWDCY